MNDFQFIALVIILMAHSTFIHFALMRIADRLADIRDELMRQRADASEREGGAL